MARKVTPEERKLWNRVAATTSRAPESSFEISENAGKPQPLKPRFAIPDFKIGSKSSSTAASAIDVSPQSPIDNKSMARMRRGKLVPEAKIDLHGMTQNEALPSLTQFILRSAQRNFRMVLVITGKGKDRPSQGPIPERVGVLRQNLPVWLARPPLNSVVQDSVVAHQRHGGSGAFYVYLKRTGKR